MAEPIRILIAEDSTLFVTVLQDLLEAEPDMAVIGVAANGEEAVEMCAELRPDVILMDIQMPRMDGLSATEHIMATSPTPIFVVTSDPYHGGVDMSFKALSAGALDLTAKPRELPWPEAERADFLRKIRLLSQIPVVRHPRGNLRRKHVTLPGEARLDRAFGEMALVGIVASTGGPKALARLLADLPPAFPGPLLVVQHIMPGFSTHLTKWLNKNSDLTVVEAQDGARIEPGHVYVAPSDRHLEVGRDGLLSVHDAVAVSGHRPSGDRLLESLAKFAAQRSIGVILSGMGSDGTMGLAALHRAGGLTMVQDRESSIVYGMPQSAIDLGVVQHVVRLDELARELVSRVHRIHRRHE